MAVKKAEEVTPTVTGDIEVSDGSLGNDVKYVKVKSPAGAVSTVPDSILDALLESGYKKA